jgi:hypothetical protein
MNKSEHLSYSSAVELFDSEESLGFSTNLWHNREMRSFWLTILIFALPRFSQANTALPYDYSDILKNKPLLMAGDLPGVPQKIEEAYLKIFKTPTGQKWLDTLFRNNKSMLMMHLGLSEESAQKILDTCTSSWFSGTCSDHFPSTGHQPFVIQKGDDYVEKLKELGVRRSSKIPRMYGFCFLGDDKNKVEFDSWTNVINVTYFYLKDKNFTAEDLIPLLTHELAIYADEKSSFDALFPTYNKNVKFDKDFPDVADALVNPLIRLSLASMRSFTAEKKILEEAKLGDKFLGNSEYKLLKGIEDPITCRKSIERIIKGLAPAQETIWKSDIRGNMIGLNAMSFGIQNLPKSDEPLAEKIRKQTEKDLDFIQNASVTIDGKTTKNLCTYMSEPQIGPVNTRVSQGPRPRIEEW